MVKAWEHGLTMFNHHKMGTHHQYSNHLLVCGFNSPRKNDQHGGLTHTKMWIETLKSWKRIWWCYPPNPRSYTVTHTAWWRKLWTTHQLECGRFTQAMVNVVNSWKWGSDKQEWDNCFPIRILRFNTPKWNLDLLKSMSLAKNLPTRSELCGGGDLSVDA